MTVPAASNVRVPEFSVPGPWRTVKVTGRSEEAEAVREKGASRKVFADNVPKLTAWLARLTTKDRSTEGAERKLLSPDCAARTVTVPVPIIESVPLEMAAGPLRTWKSTGRDELAEAVREKGASRKVFADNVPKVSA